MKKMLIFTFFAGWVCLAPAQSTFEFTTYLHGLNVVPPSTGHDYETVDGIGTLLLSGNSLSYQITTDHIPDTWLGRFYGPAPVGVNGPGLYDVDAWFCRAPDPTSGDDGSCFWRGSLLITDQQAQDLMAALWYVQFKSSVFPDRAIRGQIVPVPEPSISWLLLVSAIAFIGRSLFKSSNSRARTNP